MCVPSAGAAFTALAQLAGTKPITQIDKERFALFAIPPHPEPQLAAGWINLHLLLWRYTIYELVLVNTEDKTFKHHEIWQATWTRFERKVLTKQAQVQARLRQAESRGALAPDITRSSKPMEPIASFDADGNVVWKEDIVKQIKALCKRPPKRRKQ